MELIKKFFELNSETGFQQIDDETSKDLNIDELFDKLNYTRSVIGEQYLYNLLRSVPDKSPVAQQEEWLSEYSEDKPLQEKIHRLLSKLDKPDGYYIFTLIVKAQTVFSKRTIYLFRVLQLLPSILIAAYILTMNNVFFIGIFVAFLINLVIHFYTKQISFLHAGSIPVLLRLIITAESLLTIPQIDKLNLINKEILSRLKRLKSNLSVFRFNIKFESDISGLAFALTEIIRAFFLTEPVNLNKIFEEIEKHRAELIEIYKFVGLTDTLQSVQELRNNTEDYCLPHIVDDSPMLDAADIYHPLIEDCVKNSISTKSGSFLILGSNMSGKTTFIRTIGINVLSAQTINTCFAQRMILNRQKIYSSITIKDNLLDGKSYYLSEVLRIKDIVYETRQGYNLILFDELFKGTNTIERVAGAKAVLNYIMSNPGNRVFAATHDIELVNLLKDKITPVYFTENIDNNQLTFDYLLKYESLRQRNAIRILDISDYPKEIIEDAMKTTESYFKAGD